MSVIKEIKINKSITDVCDESGKSNDCCNSNNRTVTLAIKHDFKLPNQIAETVLYCTESAPAAGATDCNWRPIIQTENWARTTTA